MSYIIISPLIKPESFTEKIFTVLKLQCKFQNKANFALVHFIWKLSSFPWTGESNLQLHVKSSWKSPFRWSVLFLWSLRNVVQFVVAWVACLCRWCGSVCGVCGVLVWVTRYCGWHASVCSIVEVGGVIARVV